MEVIKLIAIITPVLIAAATVYLRLFVRNEINELLHVIREEFVSEKVFKSENEHINHRLQLLENLSARR